MPLPDHVSDAIADHLDAIQAMFTNSKITLVMRAPGYPDGSRDLVMGDDTLADAIAAIQTQKAKAEAA